MHYLNAAGGPTLSRVRPDEQHKKQYIKFNAGYYCRWDVTVAWSVTVSLSVWLSCRVLNLLDKTRWHLTRPIIKYKIQNKVTDEKPSKFYLNLSEEI